MKIGYKIIEILFCIVRVQSNGSAGVFIMKYSSLARLILWNPTMGIRKLWRVLFFITSSFIVAAKPDVLIVTHSYNRPDFIELQYKTFKKFLNDYYEFVVFNDAKSDKLENEINAMCASLNIRCIRVPQNIHKSTHPSRRHIDCIHYAFRELGVKHAGIFVQLDSDLFPIEKISLTELIKDFEVVANLQKRHEIFWINPVIALFDMRTLRNMETMRWDCDPINNIQTDTGGYTYYYLINNRGIRIRKIDRLFCNCNKHIPSYALTTMGLTKNDHVLIGESFENLQERGFGIDLINILRHDNVRNLEFYCEKKFLHIGNSSYVYSKDQDFKIQLIKEYLNKIIKT